jgi:hypothetical protein
MSDLANWKWWVGLLTGSVLFWLMATLIGVDGIAPFFFIGSAWGLLWSLAVWPAIEEKV